MKKNALRALPLLIHALITVCAADGISVTREASVTGTTIPEAEASYTHKFSVPFLRGGSPLTEGNSVEIALRGIVSPISANAAAEVVWTPIALLQVIAGQRAGSGWNISLFGGDIYGIGVNRVADDGSAETDGSAFGGLISKSWAGAALQFDLAAVVPGDWNHVVARTYHEINYTYYTGAKGREAWWQYEFDCGENRNGPSYYGNLLIGYQMPSFFKMAGLIAEGHLFLHDTPGRELWGDDRVRWTFSALTQFAAHSKVDVAVLAQFRTMRNFLEKEWEGRHFTLRTLDTGNPLRLEFYRVVAVVTYKI